MIIWKNGDITFEEHNGMYAIFERVTYSSGITAFYQQRTKWYYRKGYCERVWKSMLAKELESTKNNA